MRQAEFSVLADPIQSFNRRDIPFPFFLNLRKDPRLDECSTCDHDPVDTRSVHFIIVGLRREAVAIAKDGWSWQTGIDGGFSEYSGAFFNVGPVGVSRVPLLPRPPVKLREREYMYCQRCKTRCQRLATLVNSLSWQKFPTRWQSEGQICGQCSYPVGFPYGI